MTPKSDVKVYLVTRLHKSDYTFLLLPNDHPTVLNNDLSEYQMLCVNKADYDAIKSARTTDSAILDEAQAEIGSLRAKLVESEKAHSMELEAHSITAAKYRATSLELEKSRERVKGLNHALINLLNNAVVYGMSAHHNLRGTYQEAKEAITKYGKAD